MMRLVVLTALTTLLLPLGTPLVPSAHAEEIHYKSRPHEPPDNQFKRQPPDRPAAQPRPPVYKPPEDRPPAPRPPDREHPEKRPPENRPDDPPVPPPLVRPWPGQPPCSPPSCPPPSCSNDIVF